MKKAPIIITEEIIGDDVEFSIIAQGDLDLASGDITVRSYHYADEEGEAAGLYDVAKEGLPSAHEDYAFSSAILRLGDKEVDFAVTVEDGQYEVSADELEEIKEKALNLTAGKKAKLK